MASRPATQSGSRTKPPTGLTKIGGNWAAMKAKMAKKSAAGRREAPRKRRRPFTDEPPRILDAVRAVVLPAPVTAADVEEAAAEEQAKQPACSTLEEHLRRAATSTNRLDQATHGLAPEAAALTRVLPPKDASGKPILSKVLALDCEMVGVGRKDESVLAQVCIVDDKQRIVYLSFVKTVEAVTNYRTHVSGVKPEHLRRAPAFAQVQREVADVIKDRIVVGHALSNDFKALLLSHPRHLIRDTAKFAPFCWQRGPGGKLRPRKLRDLAKQHLDWVIQTGEHSPAIDAIAALELYKMFRKAWESSLQSKEKLAVGSRGPKRRVWKKRTGLGKVADEDETEAVQAEVAAAAAALDVATTRFAGGGGVAAAEEADAAGVRAPAAGGNGDGGAAGRRKRKRHS